MVLTEPGLAGIVAAVREGRTTFQRIQNYTINSITKKIVTVLFLMAGLMMTGHAILTPLLMVIVMIAGDFLAMSLTTDNVRASPAPNAWHIGKLTIAGAILGGGMLVFCCAALAVGTFALRLRTPALQTLAFVSLVFGSQAVIYAIRGRLHLWSTALASGWQGHRCWTWQSLVFWRSPELPWCRCRQWSGGHAGRSGRVRRGAGFGEAAGFRAARDCPIHGLL